MSTEPKSDEPEQPPPEHDITPKEREVLLRDTLRSLQEAFSTNEDGDDADTTTELHQNAAEAASGPSEGTP
jgi:hypothetical protein